MWAELWTKQRWLALVVDVRQILSLIVFAVSQNLVSRLLNIDPEGAEKRKNKGKCEKTDAQRAIPKNVNGNGNLLTEIGF
jgi:hypothetical protein